MRTSFSYQNYPNLWDDILDYTSTEALSELRLVDHALCSAIDRRIRHVVLTSGGDPVEGPYGALVNSCDSTTGLQMSTFPSLHLITCGCCSTRCEEEECAPALEQVPLTRLTRVADIRGVLHYHFRLHGMSQVFPRLETVRLTHDAEGRHFAFQPMDAHTLVLFPSPAGLQVCRDHSACKDLVDPRWPDDEDSDEFENPWASEPAAWPTPPPWPSMLHDLLPASETGEIRPGTRRVVVNFGGHVANPAASFHCLYSPGEDVEEIVFVLPHITALDAKGTVSAADPHELVEVMRSPTARHTVVGAECVGEGFADGVRHALKCLTYAIAHPDVDYNIDDEITRDMSPLNRSLYSARANVLREEQRLFAHVRGGPEAGEPKLSLQQKIEGQLSRLDFLTVGEYRKRVGDETATLHLMQYAGRQ